MCDVRDVMMIGRWERGEGLCVCENSSLVLSLRVRGREFGILRMDGLGNGKGRN